MGNYSENGTGSAMMLPAVRQSQQPTPEPEGRAPVAMATATAAKTRRGKSGRGNRKMSAEDVVGWQRWPSGRIRCTKCGGANVKVNSKAAKMPYQCTDCSANFQSRSDTLMHRSKPSDQQWLTGLRWLIGAEGSGGASTETMANETGLAINEAKLMAERYDHARNTLRDEGVIAGGESPTLEQLLNAGPASRKEAKAAKDRRQAATKGTTEPNDQDGEARIRPQEDEQTSTEPSSDAAIPADPAPEAGDDPQEGTAGEHVETAMETAPPTLAEPESESEPTGEIPPEETQAIARAEQREAAVRDTQSHPEHAAAHERIEVMLGEILQALRDGGTENQAVAVAEVTYPDPEKAERCPACQSNWTQELNSPRMQGFHLCEACGCLFPVRRKLRTPQI